MPIYKDALRRPDLFSLLWFRPFGFFVWLRTQDILSEAFTYRSKEVTQRKNPLVALAPCLRHQSISKRAISRDGDC